VVDDEDSAVGAPETHANPHEAVWRGILLGTDPGYRRQRRFFKHLPGMPRCKMCAIPFGGPTRPLVRAFGRGPWEKNPHYCAFCFNVLTTVHGGAEIDCTLLFADVRGSTSLAEGMTPQAFQALMTHFYAVAGRELVQHDAVVDKFVGDEVVAIFIPALAGAHHAGRAIEAARALLRATGTGGGRTPWLPLGAGIHTGAAYVGAVGDGQQTQFTAMGDVVNVAARLASSARAGEILVSDAAAAAATLDVARHEHRRLELKGKSLPTNVVVISESGARPDR
jgi:adenylate cyclase